MNRDLHNNIKFSRAMSPVITNTGTTAIVSEILDTANFNSHELVMQAGSLADVDATFTLLIEDGDTATLTDNAAVADAYLLGTEAGSTFLFSDDNATHKIGYIGAKRYIRATLTPAANSGDIYMAAVWAQGGAHKGPVA